MSDSLRDRIADAIETADMQWEFEFAASQESGSAYVDPGPKGPFISQAVIDELGLTEEAHPNKYLSDTRVVGRWEKHPNHSTHHPKCGCV